MPQALCLMILETKIPPPLVVLILAAAMWLAALGAPAFAFRLPLNEFVAGSIALVGLVLNIYPKFLFNRAGTSINPMRPDAAASLVTSGIYRYTRNPMYLGHALLLLGMAAHLCNGLSFLALPLHLLYITRFQIRPEERALSMRFPHEYAAYVKAVPRWV